MRWVIWFSRMSRYANYTSPYVHPRGRFRFKLAPSPTAAEPMTAGRTRVGAKAVLTHQSKECRRYPFFSNEVKKMQFIDDSLLPENQEPLVIQVAPYGPQFLPGDSDDIPVSMDEQVQKAVDCYNAGATVLHVHVREADG